MDSKDEAKEKEEEELNRPAMNQKKRKSSNCGHKGKESYFQFLLALHGFKYYYFQ